MPTLAQIRWRARGHWVRARNLRQISAIAAATSVVGLGGLLLLHRLLAFEADVSAGDQVVIAGAKPIVIDGDTVRWQGRSIRLIGFDTPEIGNRARCGAERVRANSATARLRQLVANGTATVEFVRCACPSGTEGTDACNRGRSCGVLKIDGRDAGQILIREGLARPYHCRAHSCPPRGSWC
jgi:endonuclease YncB( thermonuclease family)